LGVECDAYGVKGTGLDQVPDNKNVNDLAINFFHKSWKEDGRKNK